MLISATTAIITTAMTATATGAAAAACVNGNERKALLIESLLGHWEGFLVCIYDGIP